MNISQVPWPGGEANRLELAVQRKPRLLLVDPEIDPPTCADILEDWVRLPVTASDLDARVRGLEARMNQLTPHAPSLDRTGTVSYRAARVEVTPLQARLLTPLIDRFGAVVGRPALVNLGWPGVASSHNTLDVHMMRLRRRLEPLGLQVRTVRSRGYLLAEAVSSH